MANEKLNLTAAAKWPPVYCVACRKMSNSVACGTCLEEVVIERDDLRTRLEAAESLVAAMREALSHLCRTVETLSRYDSVHHAKLRCRAESPITEWAAVNDSLVAAHSMLTNSAAAAQAHNDRIRREALKEAADLWSIPGLDVPVKAESFASWLRKLAITPTQKETKL